MTKRIVYSIELSQKINRYIELYDKQKYDEAFTLLNEITQEEVYLDCYRSLAWMYYDGFGTKKDIIKSLHYFKMASKDGDLDATFGKVKCYMEIENNTKVLELLEYLSNKDYPPADYWLGIIYESGRLLDRDMHKALFFYNKASKNKHLYASAEESKLLLQGFNGNVGRLKGGLKYINYLLNLLHIRLSNNRLNSRKVF
jgi:TPR repeat protein